METNLRCAEPYQRVCLHTDSCPRLRPDHENSPRDTRR